MQAHLLLLDGLTSYREALGLQRAIAEDVKAGSRPDTVLMLEHEPVVTLGRRTDEATELHLPDGVDVEVVETEPRREVDVPRAGTARLLPDPRPQPARARPQAVRPRPRAGDRENERGVRPRRRHLRGPHRCVDATRARTRSAQDRVDRRARLALGDDPRIRAQRRARPGALHQWITACGLEDAQFTSMGIELGSPVTVADVRPAAAAALAEVFGLDLEEPPSPDLGSPRPRAATSPIRYRRADDAEPLDGGAAQTTPSVDWRRWRRLFPSPSGPAGRRG